MIMSDKHYILSTLEKGLNQIRAIQKTNSSDDLIQLSDKLQKSNYLEPRLAKGGSNLAPKLIDRPNDTSHYGEAPQIEKFQQVVSSEELQYASREELNELIGNAPGWLLRSGIMLMALITISILGMSHLISYPDKIRANGIITTEHPPITLTAPNTDRIAEILKNDGDLVETGDHLLYLHNSADKEDMLSLMEWIALHKYKIRPSTPSPKGNLNLGPIQPAYAQLVLKLNEYHRISEQTITRDQVNTLESEKLNISKLHNSIKNEQLHFKSELAIAKKEHDRSAILYEQGLISTQELEIAEAKYQNFKRQEEAIRKSVVQNDVRSDQLTTEQLKLIESRDDQLRQYEFAIQEVITNIVSSYEEWASRYHITADIHGFVQYNNNLTNGYQLNPGTKIGHIIPHEENNNKYIKVEAPSIGIAKLQESNRAIVRIEAFPAKEYGLLEATTQDISIIPLEQDDEYIYQIKIDIPDRIVTTYKKTIPYRPNLRVEVDLITKDQSILGRIFNQLRDIVINK